MQKVIQLLANGLQEECIISHHTISASGASIIDPNEHLNGNGLSLPEKIIFFGAAQQWQVNGSVYPTVDQLSIEANNIFKIDWIRTYKRVDANLSTRDYSISKVLSFSNPMGDYITIKADAEFNQFDIYQINGALVKSVKNILNTKRAVFVNELSFGVYIIKIQGKSGNWFSGKIIKQ